MLAFTLSTGTESDAPSPLGRTLSLLLEVAQHALLGGDRGVSESQLQFNTVVVTVFVEELTGARRGDLSRLVRAGLSLVADVFSPLGLLTLVGLVGARFAVARALDQRLPGLGRDELGQDRRGSG